MKKKMDDVELLKAIVFDSSFLFKAGLGVALFETYNVGASRSGSYIEILRGRFSAINERFRGPSGDVKSSTIAKSGASPSGSYIELLRERFLAFNKRFRGPSEDVEASTIAKRSAEFRKSQMEDKGK